MTGDQAKCMGEGELCCNKRYSDSNAFKHKELRWEACCHVYNHDIDKHHWEWIWGNHMIAPVAVKQPWRIWVDKWHKSRRRCKHNHVTKLRKTKLYAWCTDYTVYMIWHCADYIKLGSLVHDEEPQPLSPVGFAYGPAFCLIYTALSICLASSRHFRQKMHVQLYCFCCALNKITGILLKFTDAFSWKKIS